MVYMQTFTQSLVAAAIVASSFSLYAQEHRLEIANVNACVPSVSVQPMPFSPSEDYGMTIGDVHAETQQSSHSLTLKGTGIGAVKATTAFTVHYSEVNRCPRVKIEYGFSNVDLYVPREFKSNSCAFDHILQHERGHLEIYRRWLLSSQYRIKERLDAQAQNLHNYDDWYAAAFDAVGGEIKSIQESQKEYDSEEEYAKNDSVCNRAIPRILKRSGF
jgi:hypothetical protein